LYTFDLRCGFESFIYFLKKEQFSFCLPLSLSVRRHRDTQSAPTDATSSEDIQTARYSQEEYSCSHQFSTQKYTAEFNVYFKQWK
jgi:hypothetical protein